MSMFRNILALIGLYMFASLSLLAQTDVTNQYIVNADFSMNWATEDIGAHNAGCTNTYVDAYGWTTERFGPKVEYEDGDRKDYNCWGGPLKYGSGYTMSDRAIQVNSDGTTAGCALGISSSFRARIAYTQNVNLPSGLYKLTFYTYNVSEKGFLYNLMGVITADGVKHFCTNMNMASNVWEKHSVVFSIENEQQVTISVGMSSYDNTATSHAKFFVDKVVLEAYNAADPGLMMPGDEVIGVQFPNGINGSISFDPVGSMPERWYGNSAEVPVNGEVMSVTKTGLSNGTYWVDAYFQARYCDNIGVDVVNGVLGAYIKSNGVLCPVNVENEAFVAGGNRVFVPVLYSMRDVEVTDGTLKVEVGALQKAANWFTAKIRSIRKMTTPSVSYGAFELPTETPVTAGYWYRLVVPAGVSGTFTIYSKDKTTLTYTDNASASIDGSFSTINVDDKGTPLDLSSGTYYIKSSASTLVYFTKKVKIADGNYFLRSADGRYFGTAGASGVTAYLDAWGMCVHSKDNGEATHLKIVEAKKYVSKSGADIKFTDGTYEWDLIWCNNKYLLTKSGAKQYVEVGLNGLIKSSDSGSSFWTAAKWAFEAVDEHATKMTALKAQANLLSSSVAGLTPTNIVVPQPITAIGSVQSYSSSACFSTSFYAMPGVYSITIPAFYCDSTAVNATSYANHTNKIDCPRAYVYFGDVKMQVKCVFDEDVPALTSNLYSNGGKNYPSNSAGALTAFQNAAYKNTFWVKVDRPGNIEYGVKQVGHATNKSTIWLCYANQGIEIKRYYETGLGDVNNDHIVNDADVSVLANMLMGNEKVSTQADIIMDDVVSVYDLTEVINIARGNANYAAAPVAKPSDPTSAETTETDLHFVPAAIGARELQILCPDAVVACQFDIDLPNGIGWGSPTSIIAGRTIMNKQIASARSGYNTYRVLLYSATNAQLSAAGAATPIVSLPLTDSGLADGLYPVYVRNIMMDGGQPYLHAMHNVEKVTSYLKKGNPLVQHLPIEGRLPSYVTSAVNATEDITSVDLTLAKEIYGGSLNLQNPNALVFGGTGSSQNQVSKGVCETLSITDGHKFATPTEFQAKTAIYSRDMSATSIWGTVCVPYALTSNADVQYYKLMNADFANGSLIFERVASLEAGQPALYKKQVENATNVTMQSENVTVSMEGMSFVSPAAWTMRGSYSALTDQKSAGGTYLYYIASNKFWHAKNPISIPAFRGWFETTVAPPSSSSAPSLRISVFDDDAETAVLQLNSDGELEEVASDGIWDLSGLRRKDSSMHGIKVVHGTKVWTK